MARAPPLSLDDALQQGSLGKWEFYSAVTGSDWWGADLGMGQVHPFKITPDNLGKIHKAAWRLRKNYGPSHPIPGVAAYYAGDFKAIDAAYRERNCKKMQEAVWDLLTSIVCE